MVKKSKSKSKVNVKTIILRKKYIPLSRPLIECMGLINAMVLTALVEHHNYLIQVNKSERKEAFYYKAEIFESKLRISLYQQNQAIKELSQCGILKVTGRFFGKQKFIKINYNKLGYLFYLLYEADWEAGEETSAEYFDELKNNKAERMRFSKRAIKSSIYGKFKKELCEEEEMFEPGSHNYSDGF